MLYTCVRCQDTTGPWTMMPDGLVCENCLEKELEIIEKEVTNYLKGKEKNDL